MRELWAYRELLYFLMWRDVKVRYKQTILGATWAVLQPVLLVIVFSIFLGRLAGVPSEGVPYPLFAFAGLVPWSLFSQSLVAASNSLVQNSNLISKVYFPRLLVPLASAGSYVVDFLMASAVLIAVALYYGVAPAPKILALLPLTGLALFTACAVGIWLAAASVRYRDVRYAVPFLVQVWLFASPVAYPASVVPDRWRTLYALNPMTGVVESFRWALLGTGEPFGTSLVVSIVVVLMLAACGLVYFQRVQRTFADVI